MKFKVKRRYEGVILPIILLILASPTVSAQKITVEKILQNEEVRVGGRASIALNISNPYSQPLTVRIKDRNVIGNNGLDIQCLEVSIPPGGGVVQYGDIIPFAKGEFALDAAEVTYQDPNTGKEERVKSNKLIVKVLESKGKTQGKQQGITTIYRCGNVNMQSTSYSSTGSSSSIQISIGGSGMSFSQQLNNFFQQMKPKSLKERLQEMQQSMAQDTQALKQQMERELKRRKEMENALRNVIQRNQKFQEMERELIEKGYNLTKSEVRAISNNSGEFEYVYSRGNKTATISGRVEKGNITELTQWGEEQKRQLLQALQKNPRFQELEQNLRQEGYKPFKVDINYPERNRSKFNIQYIKNGNHQANITGVINLNGTVEEIKLNKGKVKESFPWWIIAVVILLLALAGYFIMKKKMVKKGEDVVEIAFPSPKIDYREMAKRMIEEAKKLFEEEEREKAYAKVSEAIRYYFKHELKHPEDMTDYELIKLLEKKKHEKRRYVKNLFNLSYHFKWLFY